MEGAMTRLHRKVPERFQGAEGRMRRIRARPRIVAAPQESLPDLSGLILYGQA